MIVKDTVTDNVWPESYDEERATSLEEAEKICREMVANYNRTLRPTETPREFVSVSIEGESVLKHQWEKDLLRMSAVFRGSVIDGMICARCGVTGKRFGLSSNVKIDSKFKKKVFQTCGDDSKAAVRRVEQNAS